MRSDETTSADLRRVYDEAYYTEHMAGHHLFGSGRLSLQELTNVRRSYALVLNPSLSNAVDVGAGRGELARHLLEKDVAVTILDYSDAAIGIARQHVGEDPRARLVTSDAARLGDHVAPESQDAIFMTDVVEHISSGELREIFAACHRSLRPDGVLAIHTPEKHYGSVVTTRAVHRYHINLLDIDALRGLLAESFECVDAFTWNGIERFSTRGRCIELFAYARKRPYRHTPIPISEPRVASDGGTSSWAEATLSSTVSLPPRFLLRASLHVADAAPDAIVQLVFWTGQPRQYFWTSFHVRLLADNPAELQIASEMTGSVGEPSWEDVDRVAIRVRAPGGEPFDVRIDDVRLLEHCAA
jgi:2-polyprenyl-3-methyl-5-hydroxy-6-metoxy-1,4-benzoquinol methylase